MDSGEFFRDDPAGFHGKMGIVDSRTPEAVHSCLYTQVGVKFYMRTL